MSTNQQAADARRVELLNQFIHFPGAAWANCRMTDCFHWFISACEENLRLLKFGSTGAGAGGTTQGFSAQRRYLVL